MSEQVLLIGSDAEALEALRNITNALIVTADKIIAGHDVQKQPLPFGLAKHKEINEGIKEIEKLCAVVKERIDPQVKHETLITELKWLRTKLQTEASKDTGAYAVVAQGHLADLIFHFDSLGGRKGKGKYGKRPRRGRHQRAA